MTSFEMELEVKVYVRYQQWLMDYYMMNKTSASEDLRKQMKKKIRREVIEEYKSRLLKDMEELL